MATTSVQSTPTRTMQGVAVPAESVNKDEFMRRTRRHIQQEKQITYAGQSGDVVELRKSDILVGITIRFTGALTVTPGGGTVASTAHWPYDLISAARFTANGASNLINVGGGSGGSMLKLRDLIKRSDLNDRGVSQIVGGTARTNGTFSLASESWGVGSNTSTLGAVTNAPVELEWFVPVAEDEIDMAGAIFLQTTSSDLTLALDYTPLSGLFVTTGGGTVSLTGTFQIHTTKYSIPVGPNGQIVVPDLSLFHSLISSRTSAGLASGENETRLVGQGPGKALLRIAYRLWNGAGAASAPVPMTAANYGPQGWRYGGNDQPDTFIDGTFMRMNCERTYNSDIGGIQGWGVHEFAAENALRDVVDLGTAAELRLVTTLQNSLALASPVLEYVTETVFQSGQAA